MKVLVFAGAGASVELGVPAMLPMMRELVSHLTANGVGESVLEDVREAMATEYFDIEDFIAMLDGLAATARSPLATRLPDVLRRECRELRSEAEWFVQHACERVLDRSAAIMWGDALTQLSSHDAVIATTNYDRAVELAGASRDMALVDGFETFAGREWAPYVERWSDDGVILLKLHGSTDWYRARAGDSVVKLRHPMPLFGGVALHVDDLPGAELRNAVILPSREKFKNESPFSSLLPRFFNFVHDADLSVFIGTSLRDPDIRTRASECAQRGPTFVVGPNAPDVLDAMDHRPHFVPQTASHFLMSTLPSALMAADPVEFLAGLANSATDSPPNVRVLSLVLRALDERSEPARRCSAIEKLAGAGVSLSRELVEPLLTSEDPEVSVYSLALLDASTAGTDLKEFAERLAEDPARTALAQEIQMLKGLAGLGE